MFEDRVDREACAAAIGSTILEDAPDEPFAAEDVGGLVLLLVQFFMISFLRSL